MKLRRSKSSTRKDKRFQRSKRGIEPIDGLFEIVYMGGFDASDRCLNTVWRCKIGSKLEEIILNVRQHLIHVGRLTESARHSETGIQLIHSSICLDAAMIFAHASAAKQGCLSTVAGSGVDFHSLFLRSGFAANSRRTLLQNFLFQHFQPRLEIRKQCWNALMKLV